ncbi:MAG: dipeptidase PepE [Ginsengibacter sp.]
MASKKILALSSSRSQQSGYFETALPIIEDFLQKGKLEIAFIPFASVDSHQDYADKVSDALKELPHNITMVTQENAKEIIGKCECIMVGGGNTFKLLHDLYDSKIIDLIRDKVDAGIPYIGWSAGSNILGPTISTTNDMPIIEPKSFNALGLLPFQINPHYYSETRVGFNGETRDMRLEEFLKMNHGINVIALPEGTALLMEETVLKFIGNEPGVDFSFSETEEKVIKTLINEQTDLGYLL